MPDSPQLGMFSALPEDAYRGIDALNYSTLKHMMRSPLSYRWHLDNPQEPTAAMQLGTAAHRTILEPHRMDDFAVWPAENGRRYGKVWDAFKEKYAGKQLLTEEERDYVAGITAAVHKCEAARKYLTIGESEVSMVWRDPAANRIFKGRIDRLAIVNEEPVLVGLKTARDARPFPFGAVAYRLGYHLQWALYFGGYYYLTGKMPRLVEIAVENRPPFETVVYTIPDDIVQQGKDDCSRLLKRLAECERTNTWPPDITHETELSLPSYAYGDIGDDLSDLELVAIE